MRSKNVAPILLTVGGDLTQLRERVCREDDFCCDVPGEGNGGYWDRHCVERAEACKVLDVCPAQGDCLA